jgi:diguanylate cyclase (GGDEF)-like protein
MEKNCTLNTWGLAITLVASSYYVVENTLISSYGFIYIFSLIISVVVIAMLVKSGITHKKHKQLKKITEIDSLTSLLNRRGINEYMEKLIEINQEENTKFAVFYLDIDNFKVINDTLGHHIGDLLLVEIGKKLQTMVRDDDAVGRIGGDEFILLINDIHESGKALLMARRIIEDFSKSIDIESHIVDVSFSIGISVYPFNGKDQSELFKAADIAMYHAKDEGKNDFRFYTDELNQKVQENIQMYKKLEDALENKEFVLLYQPKFDYKNSDINEAEALLRWKENDTLHTASDFIKYAQRSKIIIKIGNWVLNEVCRQIKVYEDMGSLMRIAINISEVQLKDHKFVSDVRSTIEAFEVTPSLIEFEISESILIKDSDKYIAILRELKEIGVMLAIDEFGKGFSSMGYMSRLPIDKIKIDKTLINEIFNSKHRELVSAIVALGHAMDLCVTAEGIEIDSHFKESKRLLIDSAQGYYFAKPLEADALLSFYKKAS